MSFVQQLIKKFIKHEEKILLGRWNIDYCKNAINQKVDLSNEESRQSLRSEPGHCLGEDHCGLCNQYRVIKNL